MAALGPEVARQSKHVRQAVTENLEEVIESLASLVRETTPAERRNRAIRIFTMLVGAMVTARAVNDSAVADTIMRTVEEALSESLDFTPGARTKLPEHKKRPRS